MSRTSDKICQKLYSLLRFHAKGTSSFKCTVDYLSRGVHRAPSTVRGNLNRMDVVKRKEDGEIVYYYRPLLLEKKRQARLELQKQIEALDKEITELDIQWPPNS